MAEKRASRLSNVDEIHTEAMSTKICIICLTIFAMAISCAFCGLYWQLWTKAVDADPQYDLCVGLASASTGGPGEEIETNWTFVYALNCFLYLSLSVISIALLLGAWLWPLRVVGCLGHCIGLIAHIAAIVVTGVMRYGDEGGACSERDVAYNTDGDTFKEDSDQVNKLFIAQCSLFFFYNCCVQFSTICGNIGHSTKEKEAPV